MEDQVRLIHDRISKERRMLEGAQRLLVNHKDPAAIALAQQNVRTSQQTIEYLEAELRRLTVQSNPLPPIPQGSGHNGSPTSQTGSASPPLYPQNSYSSGSTAHTTPSYASSGSATLGYTSAPQPSDSYSVSTNNPSDRRPMTVSSSSGDPFLTSISSSDIRHGTSSHTNNSFNSLGDLTHPAYGGPQTMPRGNQNTSPSGPNSAHGTMNGPPGSGGQTAQRGTIWGNWFGGGAGGAGPIPGIEGLPEPRFPRPGEVGGQVRSAMDYWRTETPLSTAKIAYKLKDIRHKETIELKVREGAERLHSILVAQSQQNSSLHPSSQSRGGVSGEDQARLEEVTARLVESTGKVQMLGQSVAKYRKLWTGGKEPDPADDFDPALAANPPLGSLALRTPLNGRLQCTVLAAINLPSRKSQSDLYAVVRVDQQERGRTKPNRAGTWRDQPVVVDVERAYEVEVAIHEQGTGGVVGTGYGPGAIRGNVLGMAWFRLTDLQELINGLAGSPSSLGGGTRGSASSLAPGSGANEGPASGGTTTPPRPRSRGPSSASLPRNGVQGEELERLSLARVAEEGTMVWLELEPGGQVLLRLNFVTVAPREKGSLSREGVARRRPVKKLFAKRGHKFAPVSSYQIMNTTDSEAEASGTTVLKHRIPHRFNTFFNPPLGGNWCSHCGLMLAIGRTGNKKCTECGVVCHESCEALVPSMCGLAKEDTLKIMEMIETIEQQKAIRKQAEDARVAKEEEQKRIKEFEEEDRKARQQEEAEAAKKRSEAAEARMKSEAELRRAEEVERYRRDSEQKSVEEQMRIAEERRREEIRKNSVMSEAERRKAEEESRRKHAEQQAESRRRYEEEQRKAAEERARLAALEQAKIEEEARQARLREEQQKAAAVATAPSQIPVPVAKPVKQSKWRVSNDDFNFLAVLGRGAYGKVMMAEDKMTGTIYAIKVIKKQGIVETDDFGSMRSEKAMFVLANRERFAFLVNLHSCYQTENRIYFVQEFIAGGDMMWHVQHAPNGRFSEERAKFYAVEILLALEYFHKSSVLYRDLKLENLLLTMQGHVKVADYGLCKENIGPDQRTNTYCGTPEYMAPEIVMNKPYGKAVDWWAYGVLLYQMLTGTSPFRGSDDDEISSAILNDDVIFPPYVNLSKEAAGLIRRLLNRDPARRLGSGPADGDEIKKHPFFRGVDFEGMLQLKYPAPFLPKVKNTKDTSNFDSEFTREQPVLTPTNNVLSARDQEEFRGFSYVSEWAVEKRSEALGKNLAPGSECSCL
ncbi:Serine/threonine kinase [Gonapodya sp. JEL0774]|nr:Serine/threonine kinase [Gonapodya sp. JEL0774]